VASSWFLFYSYHNDAQYNKYHTTIVHKYYDTTLEKALTPNVWYL